MTKQLTLVPSQVSKIITLFLMCLVFSTNHAQQPPANPSAQRDRGIKLYQQGDTDGAIETLRAAVKATKTDSDAWHYLGLAWLRKGNKAEARRAFEEAATLRLRALSTTLPISSVQDPASRRQQTAELYQSAIDSFERYLEVASKPTDDWLVELDALRFYRDYYRGASTGETILPAKEATTRIHILSKPAPDFSGTRASGTSVLRAVFSADGTVKHVLVLRRIDPRFDQACLEAAKHIQFEPAIKDGRAVSTILQLEYDRRFY